MASLALLGGPKAVTAPRPLWPQVGEVEIAAVQAALVASQRDSSYLNSMPGEGPVADFEARLRAHLGRAYAVATNSGAAAIQMALYAAGVGAGDEVIVSPYTWGQTVSPILHQLGTPVFADIDAATYVMTPAAVAAAVTPRTRAILAVHIFGHPVDMAGIRAVGRRHGLPVIEDCAQAMGARVDGREVGTFGDLACFSFGDGKQIIGGDGGCVVTDAPEHFERLVEIGSHPARQTRDIKTPATARYIDSLTYTFRIHPLAAVLVSSQLGFLHPWNAQRRQNHQRLNAAIAGLPYVRGVHEAPGAEHVFYRYSPTFVADAAEGLSREAVVQALEAEGVPMNLGYVRTPIYLRPRFQERVYFFGRGLPWSLHPAQGPRYAPGDCPVAERRCAHEELDMGLASALRGDQSTLVDQYAAAFHKVWEERDRLRQWRRTG